MKRLNVQDIRAQDEIDHTRCLSQRCNAILRSKCTDKRSVGETLSAGLQGIDKANTLKTRLTSCCMHAGTSLQIPAPLLAGGLVDWTKFI